MTKRTTISTPPVKPRTAGGKKLNLRAWNAERTSERNRIIAVDLGCIKRERPAEQFRVFERAMREAARLAKVSETFPDFDAGDPTAIYYLNYRIRTMDDPDDDGGPRERWNARWKAIFHREAAMAATNRMMNIVVSIGKLRGRNK